MLVKILVNRRGSLRGILCESGKSYHGDIIFYHLGYIIRNQIAKQPGCEVDDEGFVKVNNIQQTTIPNAYAAGDIANDRHYVVFAAANRALAAISIYESLLKDAIKRKYMEGYYRKELNQSITHTLLFTAFCRFTSSHIIHLLGVEYYSNIVVQMVHKVLIRETTSYIIKVHFLFAIGIL